MEVQKIEDVNLSDIELSGINVRTDLDTPNSQENLKELAESIRENGLMQPILLRGTLGSPPYDVIVGQRRFLAHKLLEKETIRATFSGEIGDREVLLLSLSENICRQELNYTDIQDAITELYNMYGKDIEQVRSHLGLSTRKIRSFIKIKEQASDKIHQLLEEKKISMADAKRAIDAAQGDTGKADILIDEIVDMTKYEKKRLVDFATSNSDKSVDEIVENAKKPRVEETVILRLPLQVHKALEEAANKLELDGDEIAMKALQSWLITNDFLIEG